MATVVTFTPNPAIDLSTTLEQMRPFHKLRCAAPRRDPGGGGINVARVVRRLGGNVVAVYPAGGATGQLLRRLAERELMTSLVIEVGEETRQDLTVCERATGQQFRFVFPGAELTEREWRACLALLAALKEPPSFVVASGSLPPGVPDDLYARVARIARDLGARMVLDTSGPALRAALREGATLVKPNLNELRGLTGDTLSDYGGCVRACRSIIEAGGAHIVVVTLGDDGAILVTGDEAWRAPGLPVRVTSAAGAGDSFLGAMVWALAADRPMLDAFRYGVAAGSAALLNPGTELCHASDVHRLYADVAIEPLPAVVPPFAAARIP